MIQIQDNREFDKLQCPFFAENKNEIYIVYTNDKEQYTMFNITKGKNCPTLLYSSLEELMDTHVKLRPVNGKIVIEK